MADRAARTDPVPAVTSAQMREIDRIMVEDLGISLLQMMENAGRALAELTRLHCGGVAHRRVVVLAGAGWRRRDGLPTGARTSTWCSPTPTWL